MGARLFVGSLLLCLTACSAPSDTAATWTTTAAPTSTVNNTAVADAAERYVLENLMADSFPAGCSTANEGTPRCWQASVTGFTYGSGVLRVMVQPDPAVKTEVGENAARAVANFIRLGDPAPPVDEVQWVEAVDGTSTSLAQFPVR